MKKICSIALLGFLFFHQTALTQNGLDQYLPTSGGEVVILRVNELNDKEIGLHADAARRWFSKNGFPCEQVEETDPSRDLLEGRGTLKVLWGPNNFEQYFKTLKFRIEIVLKKDRYQYRFHEFVVVDGSREAELEIYKTDSKLGSRYNPPFYREIELKISLLAEDLNRSLNEDLLSVHSVDGRTEPTHPSASRGERN